MNTFAFRYAEPLISGSEPLVPLCKATITCPHCETVIDTSKCSYTSTYIECTNESCSLRYIPRDSKLRKQVLECLKTLEEKFFYEGCKEMGDTTCLNCKCKYQKLCVYHNSRLSICPSCSYPNPHTLTKEMKDCLIHPESWKNCKKCGRCFSIENYHESCCAECYNETRYMTCKSDYYYEDGEGGQPFVPEFPLIAKFEEVKFEGVEERLEQLSSQYLKKINWTALVNYESRFMRSIEPSKEFFDRVTSKFIGFRSQ
jgi:hypothetical protein